MLNIKITRSLICMLFIAFLVFAPYSRAYAHGCCTVTSDSSSQVRLRCPNIQIEAQVRIEATNKTAVLIRAHEAFYNANDGGIYITNNEIAQITNKFTNGAMAVLTAFVDTRQNINYLLSYQTPDGVTFTTSKIYGEDFACLKGNEILTVHEFEIPGNYKLKTMEFESTPANLVYSKLFIN